MAEKHIPAKIKSYFSASANRQNLESGEEIQTSLSKVKKWFSDLGTAAFTNSTDYAAASHNQPSSTINAMTGYSKPQATSAITASDTLNEAIGKLEKAVDGAGTPNDGVLTIQQNGTTLGTFSANQAENTTVNIEAAPAPYIISNAVNSDDGTSVVLNGLDVGITDTVNYSNLFAGETYTLKTKVYNTVTQTYLSITKNGTSSTEITSTITPSTNSGSYINSFSIDNLFNNVTDNTILNIVEQLYYNNEIISTHSSSITVDASLTSWGLLQQKVRANKMSNISIGDQFTCSYGNSTLTWDVIGKNQDTPSNSALSNSLTLRLHNQLSEDMVFDAAEAFYYCSSQLNAGTYYVYVPYFSTYYNFTLKKPVPVGGQICFEYTYTYVVTTYSSATSTTPIETVGRSSGSSGTYLGTVASGGGTPKSGDLNTYSNAVNGNSIWELSAIRQWLNSDKPAGEWWVPQNKWDRPPSYASTKNGFLYDLDPELVEVLGKTAKATVLRNSTDFGYITNDTVFLLSLTEVYGGNANSNYPEGQVYSFYLNGSSLPSPSTNVDSNRITYRNGTASEYSLRTQGTSGDAYSRIKTVASNGFIRETYEANNTYYGIIAVCNII